MAEARQRGVGTLALTDHDSVEGLEEALAAGRALGVDIIPAVELNTDLGGAEVHILGYFVDATSAPFRSLLAHLRSGRRDRARRMVERLQALGVPVSWSEVEAVSSGGAVGRPHVARALVRAGVVGSVAEAFERFLARGAPAYVPRTELTPEEAVRAILEAGGVPVLAHPGWASSGPVLDRVPLLVEHGLGGIEAYYPDHSPAWVSQCVEMARRYGLVVTGGTDFHGGGSATRVPLGSVEVPPDVVPALRRRWEAQRRTSGA